MKTMKSFGYFLMLFVLGVGFSSCGDTYESRLPELLIKDMEFDGSKQDVVQSQTFRNEDMTNYGISTDASWCEALIDYDTSTIKVTVRGRAQSTDTDPYSARSCKVTLTDVRDNTIRSFNVSQKQLNEVIVNGNEYQVPSEGGEVSIEVQYNVPYQLVIPGDVTWITEKKAATRGLETASVVLNVEENNSGAARSATVAIKSTDESISRTIIIAQAFTPTYTIDPEAFTIDELAQTVKVNVTANFKFETYPDADWVVSGGRETVSETQFVQKLDVSAFKEKKDSRETTVQFFANVKTTVGGDYRTIEKTITITQNRTLYIPKDTIKLAAGDSIVVEVVNTEKRDLVWSTSDDSEFTVDSKGEVKCLRSDGDGKATITVKSKDGKYSDKIIAIAEKPKDLTKFLSCKWDRGEEIVGKDTTYTIGCTISMADGGPTITLKGYTFYNDSTAQKTVSWDGKTLSAKGSVSTSDISLKKEIDYYVDWKYTYAKEDYILRFSMDNKITITKQTPASTPAPAATTRRSARARRR